MYDTDKVLPAALALAEQIAKNSPIAVRESKRVIEMATLDRDAEQLETQINKSLRGSDEQRDRFNRATTKVTGVKI